MNLILKQGKIMKRSLVVCAALLTTQIAMAGKLTDAQRQELYERGTVTVLADDGTVKGHFEVRFMEGSRTIRESTEEEWQNVVEILDDFVDVKGFWQEEVCGGFFDGIEGIRYSFQDGIMQIDDDFYETLRSNRERSGSFGSTAYSIGNWIMFGAKVVGRTLYTTVGASISTVYTVLAPTGSIVYRPVAAGTKAVLQGMLWPVLRYTWNGTAWVLVKGSNEPKPGDLTVSWIPEDVD